jgi:hypothetical protein
MKHEIIYETPSDERTGEPLPNVVRAVVLEIDENNVRSVSNIFECNSKRAVRRLLNTYYDYKLPRAIDQTVYAKRLQEEALPQVTRRYSTGGFGKFPFFVEGVGANTYIVYAATIMDALVEYQKHHTYGPYSIRLMADNE